MPTTRQLRPHNVSGAFLPDKGAWLRYWRLYRCWRRCSEKNNGPTPMERLCKVTDRAEPSLIHRGGLG
jgi:hypothetical protein